MQASLFPDFTATAPVSSRLERGELARGLRDFADFGTQTRVGVASWSGGEVPLFENEFWTSKQRAGHSLHEVSYRACFKPQLPRFFIERLSRAGEVIYDPFMGRGTTPLEAALLGRKSWGSDLNPVAVHLARARLNPPTLVEIGARLDAVELDLQPIENQDLLVFYEAQTLAELESWRRYFASRQLLGRSDKVDSWLQMVALNRLTGHSPGFFSVYTMPPNQAVSLASQRKINARRGQTPAYRDTKALMLRKSRGLLSDFAGSEHSEARIWQGSAEQTNLPAGSVALLVTSPPFLDVVDYKADNWLRAWFCGESLDEIPLWQTKDLAQWKAWMAQAFSEWHRILKPGAHIAFEVGEIKKGRVNLEQAALELGADARFLPLCLMVNTQQFTKTAHCWGVENMALGTNSNRVVVLQKV